MNFRLLPLLALAGFGCEFLVPLDYTGGRLPERVTENGGTGAVGTGGTVLGGEGGNDEPMNAGMGGEPEGGTGGVAGTSGTSGDGAGGNAASGAKGGTGGAHGGSGGDVSGAGGTLGGTSGRGGDGGTGDIANSGGGGTGGADTGGRAGAGTGGLGGNAGTSGGMNGGKSGGGMGGTAGCSSDLANDAMHCGSCTNACDEGVKCEHGQCITAPCVGICEPASTVPLKPNDGYRVEPVPLSGGCYEVASYTPTSGPPGIVCWNFGNRSLEVNDATTPCKNGSGAPLSMGERAGGYCVKVGPSTDTCSTCPGFVLPLISSASP